MATHHWRDFLRSSTMNIAMKRGPFLLVITLAVVATAVATCVAVLHDGLSARAIPSRLEYLLANRARKLSMPSDAKHATNPFPATAAAVHEGALHFADHCSVCHGNDGGGQTMFGLGLYPKPPDLRSAETQKLTDGELFWIIENGVRFTGMPAFSGHGGSGDDSWRLVLFIRHLPQLTPEELAEMERYNPKGVEDRVEEQEEDDFLNGPARKSGDANSAKTPPQPRPKMAPKMHQ